jgi:hypothetical protein
MRVTRILAAMICFLSAGAFAVPPRSFDWVPASDETSALDPSAIHAGRVYHPGYDGGNLHVDIASTQPVTIAMTTEVAWTDAQQHPENMRNLSFSCMREHVMSTTYECALPPSTPMVLLVRDERAPNRVVRTRWGVIVETARQYMQPNNLHITYYRWDCVANCVQPEFLWTRLVKEKYELTSVPKMYNVLTPEHDGQRINVRFKAPVPMTIAVLPAKTADQLYSNPASLNSALETTSCKQRGVQSLSFDCSLNVDDGPQSLVVIPDTSVPSHKKASVELQTLRCTANCELINK